MIPEPMAVGRISRTVRTRFAAKARSSGQGQPVGATGGGDAAGRRS